jgi:hypothetical protein
MQQVGVFQTVSSASVWFFCCWHFVVALKKNLRAIVEAGGSASKAVSSLTTSLDTSIKSFVDQVPFKQLVTELPNKLIELIKLLVKGIDNPG